MSSKEGDAQLFEVMKNQMGMDPAKCDPATIDLLRQKFFGRQKIETTKEQKQAKSKANNIIDRGAEDTTARSKNRSEAEIHLPAKVKKVKRADGKEVTKINPKSTQLDFADILSSLDKNKAVGSDTKDQQNPDVINTTKLKKQLKNLKKDSSKQMAMPLSGIKRQKIMREQANEVNKKLVGKFLPQVKINREEEQHDFTTADKIRNGGNVNLKSIGQMASNVTEANATSDMEKAIQSELRKAGLQSEKDLVSAEFNALSGIDAAQLEQRYKQLSKMKHLLFRQEHKNKRIKKIKSKLYHKLKKKEKLREEGKLKSYLEEVDPAAAEELEKVEELKKAEERLRLRHGGHKKWARDMRRFKGKMDDAETREEYHAMIREKNNLKDRQKRTVRASKELDSDYESGDSSDKDSSDEDGEKTKLKAVNKIKQELSGGESSGEDGGENESEDSEDEIKLDQRKVKEKKKDKKEATGIMNMKFMKTAEDNKKERLNNEAKSLVEQIQQDKDEGSDGEAGGLFGGSGKFGGGLGSKFGGKKATKAQVIDTQEVLKAAQEMFEQQKLNPVNESEGDGASGSSGSDSDGEESDMSFTSNENGGDDEQAIMNLINDSKKKQQKVKVEKVEKKAEATKKTKKQADGPIEVKFNDDSLKNFNTKTKKLINAVKSDGDDQPLNMKKLFVTEDDNDVYEQFEKEKEAEIEEDLGDTIPKAEVKRGWNEWAGQGAGINEKRHTDKVKKTQEVRKAKIEEMRKKRSDFRMKGVVLNTEERDKKFAQKFLVKELPHQYHSVEQYKKAMDQPMGKEWNTLQSHKRLIQPEVLTKAGEIIKPLRYKRDITASTVDALVQHRDNKRQKRPAAKF